MRTEVATDRRWREQFDVVDHAAWPGPRPIPADPDRRLLHGRDGDARQFLEAVIDHLVVVLTADSGVGKSSLLNGRLRPDLEQQGFHVVYIDSWHFGEQQSPGEYVGEHVVAQLQDEVPDPRDLGGVAADNFWRNVNDTYGDRLVLVLDQFEELVRHQVGLFEDTRRWITDINRKYGIRVVISLRAEYQHQLRSLEREARPFTMTTYRLEPITHANEIRSIITQCDEQYGTVQPEAVEELLGLWNTAHDSDQRRKATQPTDERPGLLHLQGSLYALNHRVRAEGRTSIEKDDIETLCTEAERMMVSVWDHGLELAITTKFGHCRAAAEDVGLDRVLVDGTDAVLGRMLPHLSSGGFKLDLDEWTIARKALQVQIDRSGMTDPEAKALYQEVKETCFASDDIKPETWPPGFLDKRSRWTFGPRTVEIIRPPGSEGDNSAWVEITYSHHGWAPWEHDPRDLSSGPMLGMPPEFVLFQELRRFAFAMLWLQAAALMRRSEPTRDRTMVALIHDGFGKVLERLALDTRESFAQAAARITAARGEELSWSGESIEEFWERWDAEGARLLVNLRWRDCTVAGVDFGSLVFVNGDFRGTRFERCTFDGVTFVNCLLDNAVFAACEIRGRTTAEDLWELRWMEVTAGGDRLIPDFVLQAGRNEVELLEHYRGIEPSGTTEVYSRTSGVAAHPAPSDRPSGITWHPANRGVAVYGGRLSSLMFSGCAFPEEENDEVGTLALRHIAGAALDLVEHNGGRLEIFDSVIRGLTISAAEGDYEAHDTDVTVVTAVMANVWIDADLRGTLSLRDTIMMQLTNCALSENFRIEIDTSAEGENVPVGVIGDAGAIAHQFERALADEQGANPVPPPWSRFAAMDYRSRPAEFELGGRLDGDAAPV